MITLLRRLTMLTIALLLLFVTIIALGNGYIYSQNKRYFPKDNADAIIILGAHIEGNPLRPSLMLQYRLDKAIEYWQENPNTLIVTTGGRTTGYRESEAKVMAQYLHQKGVPSTQILLEEDSTRTAHQFINAKNILKKAGKTIGHTIIITNDFHLPRAMMLAKRSGLTDISGFAGKTPQDQGSKITAHIREPLALLNSWLFDHPQ